MLFLCLKPSSGLSAFMVKSKLNFIRAHEAPFDLASTTSLISSHTPGTPATFLGSIKLNFISKVQLGPSVVARWKAWNAFPQDFLLPSRRRVSEADLSESSHPYYPSLTSHTGFCFLHNFYYLKLSHLFVCFVCWLFLPLEFE